MELIFVIHHSSFISITRKENTVVKQMLYQNLKFRLNQMAKLMEMRLLLERNDIDKNIEGTS